jgi:hypothetical protein
MIKTQQLLFLFMIVVFSNNFLMAQDADLKLLLDKTKAKGGICLILGAKDLSLAESLAKSTTFYSQVIQSDTVLATKWGLSVANSLNRETIGIRNAVFDPEHYGSDLLNLIIVEDITVLGKIKLADLCRILVPNGYIAFKSSPVGFAEEAKTLEMSVQAIGSYVAVYNKPIKPFEWKICDSVKWKAGAGGVGECADIEVKNGTLVYSDRFENEGDLNILAGQYIVRDAYNGRTLSSEPLGERKPIWYAPSVAAALQPIKLTPKLPHEERGDAGGFMAIKARTDGKIDLPFFVTFYFIYTGNYYVREINGASVQLLIKF